MFHKGKGVPENYVVAANWYRMAAEQGKAEAQHNLGRMHDDGEGVPENDVVAVNLYRKAAEQGYAEAQYSLGLMFYFGEGVPRDYVQAYAWMSIASAQLNDDLIKDAKEIVAKSMTGDEITRAQILSDELWNSFGPTHKTK